MLKSEHGTTKYVLRDWHMENAVVQKPKYGSRIMEAELWKWEECRILGSSAKDWLMTVCWVLVGKGDCLPVLWESDPVILDFNEHC